MLLRHLQNELQPERPDLYQRCCNCCLSTENSILYFRVNATKNHNQHQSPTPAEFQQPFSQNLGKLTNKRRSKHGLIQFSKSCRIKFTRASRTHTYLLTQRSPYQLTCPHLPCKYISRTRHRVRREFKPNLHAPKHPCFQFLELSPPL